MKTVDLYDKDFAEWIRINVELLRSGQVAEADLAHIAEEIEDMGKSDYRALKSALTQILVHLLKYRYQPAKRTRSWLVSIGKQRIKMEDILRDSPSLKPQLPQMLIASYDPAVRLASLETGIPRDQFPASCPFDMAQVLDMDFPTL